MRSCACLEGNDGFCPIHGSITRDPDELLHDAKMMEAEMKEERAPLTDQELEEIRGRLQRWEKRPTLSQDATTLGDITNEFRRCAPADIASLLAEVERLKGLITYAQVQAIEAMSAINRGKPTTAGGRMVAVNTYCDKALHPENWEGKSDAK